MKILRRKDFVRHKKMASITWKTYDLFKVREGWDRVAVLRNKFLEQLK